MAIAKQKKVQPKNFDRDQYKAMYRQNLLLNAKIGNPHAGDIHVVEPNGDHFIKINNTEATVTHLEPKARDVPRIDVEGHFTGNDFSITGVPEDNVEELVLGIQAFVHKL